jgi:hypothetical protein
MRVSLHFTLPMEEDEFKSAKNGHLAFIVLDEFDNWLRGIIKHGEDKDQVLDAQEVRDKFNEFRREYEL